MDSGGCVQTTGPEWVFGVWFLTGSGFLFAGAMFLVLFMRPRVEHLGRGHAAFLVAMVLGQTAFYGWTQYNLDGLEGLRDAVGWTLVTVVVAAPLVALIAKERSSARQGLDLRGGWLRLKTGAQVVTGTLAALSGGVAWVMFGMQLLSLRPC